MFGPLLLFHPANLSFLPLYRLLAIVGDDEVCRRLMTTPGVGPVAALTYRATVYVPARFRKSSRKKWSFRIGVSHQNFTDP